MCRPPSGTTLMDTDANKRSNWFNLLSSEPLLLYEQRNSTVMVNPNRIDYTSRVAKYTFANTLDEQEMQLQTNPLMQRFQIARQAASGDRFRPIYHYINPEGGLNDPNGLCFWQGRWHLFYQAYPPEDPRQHWGHAVSDDLIHWQDLPYAIYPNPEECCFSGATLVEADRVIAIYHGTKVGNMVAVSNDPLLLNWEKVAGKAVIPLHSPDGSPLPYRVFDPCIWEKDGAYYALSGGTLPTGPVGMPRAADFLFRSVDLEHWEYLHPFVESDQFTAIGDDGACPYFWQIGNKHMLLFFSHRSGGQYLLGDYDKSRDKFVATDHGKFNFGAAWPSGVHAPSAAPDDGGGIIAIFNMNWGLPIWEDNAEKHRKSDAVWGMQIMSLPRHLTLTDNGQLRIEPAGAVETLRDQHAQIQDQKIPANQEIVFAGVEGSTIELELEIDTSDSPAVVVDVLRSPDRQEITRITFYRNRGLKPISLDGHNASTPRGDGASSLISIDTSHSSTLADALSRAPETAPVYLEPDENLALRIFIDRSIVEVFVNGKQCVATRVYPARDDSTQVAIGAQGSSIHLVSLNVWQMKSIYS